MTDSTNNIQPSHGYTNEQVCKLFVGNVNKSTKDEDFKEYFSKYGTLRDIVLMKDNNSPHQNRGFGFVTPEHIEVADKILMETSHSMDGRELDIKRALPKDIDDPLVHTKTNRIFLGGLPHNISEEDLKHFFNERCKDMGHVTEVVIKKERQSGRPRGFCFISFSNPHIVDKLLIESRYPIINNKRCEVKKADPAVPITGVPPSQLSKYTQKTSRPPTNTRPNSSHMIPMANMSSATACYDYNSYPGATPNSMAYPQSNAYFSYYQSQGTSSNPYSSTSSQQGYGNPYTYGNESRSMRPPVQRSSGLYSQGNRQRPY